MWLKKRLQTTPLIQVWAVSREDVQYICKMWCQAALKGSFPGATEKFSLQQHLTAKCLWPEVPMIYHFSSSPFPAALGRKATSHHIRNMHYYIWKHYL